MNLNKIRYNAEWDGVTCLDLGITGRLFSSNLLSSKKIYQIADELLDSIGFPPLSQVINSELLIQ